MKIMIVTDAWEPQVNGVVRTLKNTGAELAAMDHELQIITPLEFRTIACPTYPDIRLSIGAKRGVFERLDRFSPDALHLSTEGPLGLAARSWALTRNHPFTTVYHTRFPEYVHARARVPLAWTYAYLRWFHSPSKAILAPTDVVRRDLEHWGLRNVRLWSRGVDQTIFHPRSVRKLKTAPPHIPLRRARCRREEHRSVSRAGSARLEVGGGRGACAGRTAQALPTSELSRRADSG